MKVKQKKCPICGDMFKPFSTTQRVDKPECAIIFNRQKDLAKERKSDLLRKKVFKANDVNAQHDLTKTVFNKLRRLQEFKWFQDRGLEPECISCGKTNADWCCGHFKAAGTQGALRYSEINTYLQCNRYCNCALSANIEGNKNTRGYKQGLVDRFGEVEAQRIFDYCDIARVKKWTGSELMLMRKGFNEKIRELEG